MDPVQAAQAIGRQDGYAFLERKDTQAMLNRMRRAAAGQLCREDVLRQLGQLAFGRVNDAIKLALKTGDTNIDTLDLSAVAECKMTEKGVEIKLVDRIQALKTLGELLENAEGHGADELYHALTKAAGQIGEE